MFLMNKYYLTFKTATFLLQNLDIVYANFRSISLDSKQLGKKKRKAIFKFDSKLLDENFT